MKIKSDFVTNSSSTSYIVMIPPDFKLVEHLTILEQAGLFSERHVCEPTEINIEDLKKEFYELMHGSGIIYEQDGFASETMHAILTSLLSELDFIVAEYEIHIEFQGVILNIGHPDYLKKVIKIGSRNRRF